MLLHSADPKYIENMEAKEQEILHSINGTLQIPEIAAEIDAIADRVTQKFSGSKDLLAWETVPFEVYQRRLPAVIRSSWVFLLREGCASGAERHPNSHQRVRSWRGNGDFQIWNENGWQSNFLVNGFDATVERQWASIRENVWHQAVVPPGNHWIVVSFHTDTADEIIEERPDENDTSQMQQRVYTRIH